MTNSLTAPLLQAPVTRETRRGRSPDATIPDARAFLQEPQERQRSRSPTAPASLSAIRDRYIHHLQQHRLASTGYVPNLAPILRWDHPSNASSRQPSPHSRPASPREDSLEPGCKSSTSGTSMTIANSIEKKGEQVAQALSYQKEGESPSVKGTASANRWRPGSLRSSIINISAAALGAGALALPRAIYYSGIVWGPLFMLVLAVLSMMSIKVIVQLVEVSKKDSYEEIAKVAFGPWFALLVEINIILFCFGTSVAYMITVGQISQQVLQAFASAHGALGHPGEAWLDYISPNVVLCVVTAIVLLPLSLLDSINDLRFASLAGVTCILYLIVVVCYVFGRSDVSPSLTDGGFDAYQPKGGITGCFKMLSLAIFAFCCQPNVPAVYTELEKKSFHRMEKVSVGAMLLCLFVYLVMGIAGFLAFGEETAGNVLVNLQPKLCELDLIVVSGFTCMAFAVTMAFPLNIFPIRFTVETAIFFKWPHLNTPSTRFLIGFTTVAASLLVAVIVPEINLVFELIGATTGSFVCFIGPGLMIFKLVPGGLNSGPRLNGAILIVVGCLFLTLGTYSSILDVIAQWTQPTAAAPVCPRN
mmetsp:Transcript_75929/g.158350  ORF Transcript_75929/g.158350 Transcript_75929/m.158350 type:complete len:588 (-) Transcript_75929:124-1887(-)